MSRKQTVIKSLKEKTQTNKQKKIRELFYHVGENFTELFSFKNNTADAYLKHFEVMVDVDVESQSRDTSQIMKDAQKMIKAHTYPLIINKTTLVYAVSAFEVFLGKFLTILYEEDTRSLKTNGKTMTYDEILSYPSFKALKQKMISNVLHELFYKSIAEQMKFINQKFGLGIEFGSSKSTMFDKKIDLEQMTRVFSLRNIILHNDGVVNDIYLKNNPSSKYKIGERVHVDSESAHNDIFYLFGITAKLCFCII